MTFPLSDAHTHLQSERFDDDRAEVIARAVDAGVGATICTGTRPDDWQKTAEVSQECNSAGLRCVAGFGVHPWFCGNLPPGWYAGLHKRLALRTAVVGEIGLDRWKKGLDEDMQQAVFRTQLAMARELDLPVVLHCVQAFGLLVDVLERDGVPKAGFMVHACGCAPEMLAHPVLKQAYCSFGAGVLNNPSSKTAQSFAQIDESRLLLETDSPDITPKNSRYLAHQPEHDARRNEPANLAKMLDDMAKMRNMEPAKLARLSGRNLQQFTSPLEFTTWNDNSRP